MITKCYWHKSHAHIPNWKIYIFRVVTWRWILYGQFEINNIELGCGFVQFLSPKYVLFSMQMSYEFAYVIQLFIWCFPNHNLCYRTMVKNSDMHYRNHLYVNRSNVAVFRGCRKCSISRFFETLVLCRIDIGIYISTVSLTVLKLPLLDCINCMSLK